MTPATHRRIGRLAFARASMVLALTLAVTAAVAMWTQAVAAPSRAARSTADRSRAPARRVIPAPSGEAGAPDTASSGRVPEPKHVGGESESVVQVANLVYAGTKSSKCFSDHFLAKAEKESAVSTSRRFHAVKLSSTELFNFPLVIMTGEGAFTLRDQERENLRKYIERGGFLLASAGCSSKEWDRSFRREMTRIFPGHKLSRIGMDHPVFHTVYDITVLHAKHGKPRPLEGVHLGGRMGVLYSQDGLNDTEHTQGCCCCGGNEIKNAIRVNVNVLAYALVY